QASILYCYPLGNIQRHHKIFHTGILPTYFFLPLYMQYRHETSEKLMTHKILLSLKAMPYGMALYP
ncbi:MAG: hypothetical protein IJX63_08790, partial [Lachnospiraceae bacterium]|nr:hypothetical protein [Lachnospiraceae bacterium]